MVKEEQRVYMKIWCLLNCSLKEIKADLDKVYAINVLSFPTVTGLSVRFKDCRQTVEDDPCSGCPFTAFCKNDVITVKTAV